MNIVTSAPKWAQTPLIKFVNAEEVEGTTQKPITNEALRGVQNTILQLAHIASYDGVEGIDQAEERGVVITDSVTLHFSGDIESKTRKFEGLAYGTKPDSEAEMVIYVSTDRSNTKSLNFHSYGSTALVEGAIFSSQPDGLSKGFIVQGEILREDL